jgi:pimeloyl-ACP methyl ester carboxylesterase
MHPDRVAGVIGVNTAHLPRAPMDPIQMMRMVYGDDMYIVFFQKPGVADALLAEDTAKTFRFFMRKGGMTLEEFDRQPAENKRLALVQALQTDEKLWPGELVMSQTELNTFIETYQKTGFTGPINWYRNFTRNWQESEGRGERIEVPCLMITAENDVVLRPSMADNMEDLVPNLERHLVKECGHWTQQEHPAETNEVIIDWMKRHFGKGG